MPPDINGPAVPGEYRISGFNKVTSLELGFKLVEDFLANARSVEYIRARCLGCWDWRKDEDFLDRNLNNIRVQAAFGGSFTLLALNMMIEEGCISNKT